MLCSTAPRTIRVVGAGVALHVAAGEVLEDALPLLRLSGQRDAAQERAHGAIQRLPREVKVLQELLTHKLRELVPGKH